MMSLHPVKLDGTPTDDDRFSSTYELVEYGFPERLDLSATKAEGTPTIPYRPWPFEQARFDS